MEEKVLKNATLVFLLEGRHVWLARKTRYIGAGLLNGYGGGIEAGETPKQAAVRELFEESGVIVDPDLLFKRAVVDFHNKKSDGKTFTCRVHVYVAWSWRNEPAGSDQMADPKVFRFDKLPFTKMMLADKFWIPDVLDGLRIEAEVWYGPGQKELLRPIQKRFVNRLIDET